MQQLFLSHPHATNLTTGLHRMFAFSRLIGRKRRPSRTEHRNTKVIRLSLMIIFALILFALGAINRWDMPVHAAPLNAPLSGPGSGSFSIVKDADPADGTDFGFFTNAQTTGIIEGHQNRSKCHQYAGR
jgi:hypothetical protein